MASRRLLLALLLAFAFTCVFGCEIIATVDRSDIPGAGGASASTVASSSSSSSSVSSSSSSSGGGGDGGVQCMTETECPATPNECVLRTCTAGQCGTTFVAAGTMTAQQTMGDCQQNQCDGNGKIVAADNNSDIPVDNNDCTDNICTNGMPSNPPLSSGTMCGMNLVCDGKGACVGCVDAMMCPGQDTDCQTRTCSNGTCGFADAPAGKATSMQMAGDCKENQCDGLGGVMVANKDMDLPVDNKECTDDVCTAGVPSNPPLSVGNMCNQNGGTLCDGNGACVECVVATTCPGLDTDCQKRACTNGACGFTNTPDGTPTSAQSPGDCKENQCDGMGGVKVVSSDMDLPVDGNVCTGDVCMNGVPSNPPVPAGTSCGGSQVCDANGSCVGCLVAATCPGQDNDCQTRTCINTVCGFSYMPAGTPTSMQTAGDCKENQCNGMGVVVVANKDTDVFNDNKQCTNDVCMNGVPSNPPLPPGDSCNQNGGSLCNGAGDCVQCLVAATCPGQDTDCQVRACNSGTCGFTNTPNNTPTSTQTPFDCKENQCDGMGGVKVVNKDVDLPFDNNQCTSDVCTNGVPSNPPVASGSVCSDNGGILCDGAGSCVQCLAATDCAGQDTDCQMRTCTNYVCGVSYQPPGTATSTQTAGDCKENQCDGMGGVTVANKDTDLPDDNNPCTNDICMSGVPSNPPVPSGTSCGGALLCDGNGSCVGCLVATDCPGLDTDCQTRTCTAGSCGFSYQPSGTPTSMQTSGDCKENQCDGMGGVVAANEDTDLPVDGNECTGDVCTNGVPSNPNLASHTMCSQGGLYCNGAGVCVECILGQDCSSFVCVNNVCQMATCNDSTKNATETDVDCGGGGCPACANGKKCGGDSDCTSGKCNVNNYCVSEYLMISELQSRGDNAAGAATDEFIELFNSGSAPVTFDNTWVIWARSAAGVTLANCNTANATARYTGTGQIIPAHGHLLIAGTTYNGSVIKDATLASGFTDGASVYLMHGAAVVDAVCFYFDPTSQSVLESCSAPYTCEGAPVTNAPHTNGNSPTSNVDVGIDRKPGSTAGNGQDTGDSATDFVNNTPANPQNLASPVTP